MSAVYEINGTSLRRASSISKSYPDERRHERIKSWCVRVGLVDFCHKLESWDPEDAMEHIRKVANGDDGWKDLVEAHATHHLAELERKSRIGTMTHDLIDAALIKGFIVRGIAPADAEVMPDFSKDPIAHQEAAVVGFSSWMKWHEQRAKPNGFLALSSELKLMSMKLGFGGTSDCVARFNGKDGNRPGLWLMDWKTGHIQHTSHGMQTVAYTALVEEQGALVGEGSGEHIIPKAMAEEQGIPWQPVRIEGQAIVHVDTERTSFQHYEVPIGRVGPLWRMYKLCRDILDAKDAFETEIRGLR